MSAPPRDVPEDRVRRPASVPDVPFRKMMPAPLLALFGVLAVAAVLLVARLIVRPPVRPAQPLAERRSAPGDGFTHNVKGISRAPAPTPLPIPPATCPAFAPVRYEGRAQAVERLARTVAALCPLSGGSIGAELVRALDGLAGARLRFGAFARTGVEATSDLSSGEIFVNVRYARAESPTVHLAPILVHEGYHLARRAEPVTARSELAARRAELEVCRRLIDRDKWQRNCDDALELLRLGEEQAVAVLVTAGYPA